MDHDDYTELLRYLAQLTEALAGLIAAIDDLGTTALRIETLVARQFQPEANGREA